MSSELPDLNTQSATDEMTAHTARYFSNMMLGIAVVAPWLLLIMSIMSGKFLWLTVLTFVCTHAGLALMLVGYRRDNRSLKRSGATIHVAALLLCLVTLAALQ
ncbi:hypothetical protein [Streptomyces sp. KAU_LT]|uniref:hypothetical protein n=1 Tax=Streptomyces sp. KAU_LT TaxID=3046669 RepID=UPI0024B6712E|nr:hypothetical protein [Streptomyces sp. KAU_LT]MDI9830826.1 hypothetical protein [Streptomyces sp. KAU_LT]